MGNPALVFLLVMTFFSFEVMKMNTVTANIVVDQCFESVERCFENLPKDTDFSEYDDTVRSGGKYAKTL